ncbi:MAG: polysaccharide pyruvyl transferase family protein [Rhodobacteraceae bacterium]|nr:polysaccharide pyruvyl transferase family protein [Paracoccaceae bacterium]
MLNILYKSTTHISIGDDIAFFGTKSLFDRVVPGHNAFLFSRGEKDTWKPHLKMDVDLVVIAGTPVWSGREMSSLEEYIIENNKPVFYCGVGMNYGENSRTDEALKRSIGFIARDNFAYKRASQVTDARSFSCPSIFSTGVRKQTGNKIGVILQVDTWPDEQMELIKRFPKEDVLIISNEIVDHVWACEHLPDYEKVYSRWLPDMMGYYLRCKEIYAMRIHGAHLAYALGIPTVCTKSAKDKSVVVEKIGLKLVPPPEVTAADMRNDQSIKADLEVKFMDYITLAMQKHFPQYVDPNAWRVSAEPADGRPVEWTPGKWRKELVAARARFADREKARAEKAAAATAAEAEPQG